MFPKVSPDGTRVAVTVSGANLDIWVWDLGRKTLTRLTFDEKPELQSIWTPDGKRIIYMSGNTVPNDVCWKAADGTGGIERLASVPELVLMPWSWSSDGKTLVTEETDGSAKWDIGTLSMDGNRARKPLLSEKATEMQAKISPDGRWMAYTSNESSRGEVYVRPFPEVDTGKWQVSTSGGSSPLWSPDGRELFYLTDDNSVMAVSVETNPTLSFGTPKTLFRSACVGATVGGGTPWDIHPDGKRFLMMKEPVSTGAAPAAAGPRKINLVLNWTEELKQRVPVK
jgi:Tol biopolymer transport system component